MCEILPLFGSLEENDDILDKREERIPSIASSDDRHFRFKISPTDEYINLSKTTLYYKIRILKEDGTAIDAGSEVALMNYSGAACISKMEIFVGSDQDNVII